MGYRDDQPPQAASRRGAPLTQLPLAALAALAALTVLAGALAVIARFVRRATRGPAATSDGTEREHARLYREAAQKAERMAALAGIEREFAAELDGDRLLRTIVERAARLFDGTAAFYLTQGDGRAVRAVAASDGAPPLDVTLGDGLVGRCAAERRPFLTEATTELVAARRPGPSAESPHRMGHPVVMKDRLLGVVTLRREHAASPFRADDLAVLEGFAAQAAIALENARLYQERETRALRLRTLTRVSQAITGSLEPVEVLAEMARAAARLMDATVATFWAADEAAGIVEVRACSDEALIEDLPARSLTVGTGGVGWVARERRPLIVPDVFTDGRFLALDWWRAHGLQSFHGLPLLARGKLLGVLAMARARPLVMGGEGQDLLETFVAQAAIALENARLFSETTRRLEETRALLDIAAILNSSLDSGRVLKSVMMRVAQVCRVDRASVERREGECIVPLASQYADGHRQPSLWSAYTALEPADIGRVPALAQAVETQGPVVIDDAAGSSLLPRAWIEAFRLKSCLVVPLVRGGEVIGTMSVEYVDRPVRFAPWQIDLAMAIAGQLALWLANSRLFAEAQERLRETSTLLAVSRALSQRGSTQAVMREVAREVARAFGADMIGAYFLDERREALVPLAGYHVPPELREFFLSRPIELARNPWLTAMWRSGRAVRSSDTQRDLTFDQEWVRHLPPHSVLFAAALAHGEPIGGLFLVWWQTGRQFTPAEIRLLEGVAEQVGLAMENADLVRQTQSRLAETETLLSVSRALTSTLDLDALLRLFVRTVAATVGADCVGLWTLTADGQWLEGLAGHHVPTAYLDALRPLRLSIVEHAFYAEAARTKRSVFSTDVMNDPRFPEAFRQAAPHRSHLFVPIVANERLVGGFGALWWERAREFTAGEVALMEAIASQAGVTIENARLFAENRRQVEELSALHDLSRAVTGQLDRAAVIGAVHDHIARVLDARNVVIGLRDGEQPGLEIVLRVVDGIPDAGVPMTSAPGDLGLASVVLATGRSLRTDNYAASCRSHGVTVSDAAAPLQHWLGVPLRGAGDRVIGVLVLRGSERPFSESDERLLANIAHLAALALSSAQLFAERTRAYRELGAAQDQLVRTEKLRALGEMASGVAHDFNNLLSSILGRAQLLLRRIDEEPLRQWVQVIERSALDGAQTVRRLQEFTRIRRDHPLVPVDLNQVVADALEITQPRWRDEAASRGIAIELRTALAHVPAVAGDPAELREAMTNLILNAVDAMPHGGRLGLTTRVLDDRVLVEVFDTGIGMSAEVRERIFDPFFTTKGPQGTGLGLSMTYGILARHGASITVESEEGRGSLFRLSFPGGTPAPGVPVPAVEAPPPSAGLRCLVVDDERLVGSVLGDILAMGGHQPVVLESGAEAIVRFRAEPFDAVFTDLSMPGVSGWQVARAVKDMAPSVPVFLVTGFGVELSAEERRGRGVDAVLTKPLQVHEVLDAAAAARQLGAANGTEEKRWPTNT